MFSVLGRHFMFTNSTLAKSVRLAIMFGAAATVAIGANAQETEEKETDEELVEKIEVTGSRIKRTDIEATQPIVQITADYIANRGITNALDAVTDIPGITAAATPVIADNQAAASQGVGQRTINMYGLGSQRTLTLVNGSRFISSNSPVGGGSAPGAQVDVNNIPMALIDRVEVVKVGGAPVYGADAVAGVVNYILKDDYEGAEVSYDHTSYNGLGKDTSFRVLVGGNFDDDRGNIVLNAEYNKTDRIAMKDVDSLANAWRSFKPLAADAVPDAEGNVPSNQVRLYPNARAGILSFSGLATPGPVALTALGWGAWGDQGFWQFDPNGSGDLVPYDAGTQTGNVVWSSGGDGLDLAATNTAQEGVERYNLSAMVNYKLTEDVNMAITAFANASDAENPGYQSAMYNSGIWNGTDGGALVFNSAHPFLNNQARNKLEELAGGPTDFYYHRGWINLGQREIINESSVRSLNVTFDGEYEFNDSAWTWEVTAQKGISSVFSQDSGLSNARFYAAMDVGMNPNTGELDCKFNYEEGYREGYRHNGFGLEADTTVLGNPGDCAPLNPFGTITDEARDYVMFTSMGKTRVEQNLLSMYTAGDLFEMPAGFVGAAFGFEQRTEKAKYDSDGTLVLTGNSDNATSGSYDTKDIYAEFYVPLLSSDMDVPLAYSLDLEMSYRRLDNSRSGVDNAWAVGLNYQPFEDVMIRANKAETVRAPAVTELFLPRVETNAFATDPCDARNRDSGPNPAVRKANCDAEGLPEDFASVAQNASRQGFTGGNDSLTNERAESVNVGIIYSPSWFEGFNISADWIQIDISDAIVQFTLTDIMEACYDGSDYPNNFCTMFTRGPDGQLPARFAFNSGYVNAALREFEAVEYTANFMRPVAEYPLIGSLFPADSGELGIRFSAYNQRKNATSNTGFDFTDTTGQFNDPDWRSRLNISHSVGKLTTLIDVNYWGEGARNIESTEPLQYIDENGVPYTTIEAMTTVDLSMVYDITPNMSIRGRIQNVTDWAPSKRETGVERWTYGQTYTVGITAKF